MLKKYGQYSFRSYINKTWIHRLWTEWQVLWVECITRHKTSMNTARASESSLKILFVAMDIMRTQSLTLWQQSTVKTTGKCKKMIINGEVSQESWHILLR